MLPSERSYQDEKEQIQSLLARLKQRLDHLPARQRRPIENEIAELRAFLEEEPSSENERSITGGINTDLHAFEAHPGVDGALIFQNKDFSTLLDERRQVVAEIAPLFDLLQAIFTADPGGLAVLTVPDMVCRVANQAYRSMMPDPSMNPVGKRMDQIWPENDAALDIFQQVIATRQGVEGRYQRSGIDEVGLPAAHWYTVHVEPIEWNAQAAVLVVLWETTPLEQALQEIQVQKERLREASGRLADVLDSITDMYFALDREWRFIEINQHAERNVFLRPAGELLGKVYWEAFPQTIGSVFLEQYRKAARENTQVHFEAKTLLTGRWVEIHVYPRKDRIEIYGRDITDRKEAAEALKHSEGRFRVALATLPITVFSMDRELRYTWVYSPAEGFSDKAYLGKRDDEILPAEAVGELLALKRSVIETGQPLRRENRLRLRGEWRIFLLSLDPIFNEAGAVVGLSGAALDITERRRMEAEQREYLTQVEVQRRLAEHREMERQNIAREIHDGPIQSLVSTLFHLQRAKEEIARMGDAGDAPDTLVTLEQVTQSLKGSVQELRAVVNDLRPPSLLQFGLSRVVQIHVEDLRERFPGLKIALDLFDDRDLLPKAVCLELYRVYQESLNNIIRHAQAGQVWVRYLMEAGQVVLEIKDDGRGFALPADWATLTRSNHFGVAGMKERIEALGGEFTIWSEMGKGTTIKIRVPVKKVGKTGLEPATSSV